MVEKRATWYTATEFNTMRQQCVKLARQLEQSDKKETTVSSGRPSPKLRGLERLTKTTVQKLLTRRKLLNSELQVLRQLGWKAGTASPGNNCNADECLATLFQSYTSISAREARTMAKLDAKRAKQCYQQIDLRHELEEQGKRAAAATDADAARDMNSRPHGRALSSSPKKRDDEMTSWTVESVFGEELARFIENR